MDQVAIHMEQVDAMEDDIEGENREEGKKEVDIKDGGAEVMLI